MPLGWRTSRSVWSAASLLALSSHPPRPKAGASSTHSMRFATFGCGFAGFAMLGNIRAQQVAQTHSQLLTHLFSWRRNQVVLVHFGLFQQELVAVGPNDFCAVHFRGAAQTEVEGIGRLRAVRIACDKSLATLCRENCRENRRGGGKDSASRQSVVRIVAITVSAPRIWWRNSPPPCAAIPVRRTV